jgi:hypothetical protein
MAAETRTKSELANASPDGSQPIRAYWAVSRDQPRRRTWVFPALMLLAVLLERRQPASLRVRVAPDTPAALAVDLARAAHVWRSHARKDMRLCLMVEGTTME